MTRHRAAAALGTALQLSATNSLLSSDSGLPDVLQSQGCSYEV